MTREAIQVLRDWDGYFIGHSSDDVNEALNIAIKALEQEPCEDAIDRQAVLDLMRGLTRWCVRSEDGKFNNVGLLYDDVMFGIDRLPSVTPQPYLEQEPCTVKDSKNYEELWDGLYNWLNDMRFSIAPDETVTDDNERNVRSIQVDLLDEIMEWMVDQVPKADGGGE